MEEVINTQLPINGGKNMDQSTKKFLWVIAIVNVLTLIMLTVFFVMSWDVITKKPPAQNAFGQQGGMQQPSSGTQQPSGGVRQPSSGTQQPSGGVRQPSSGTQQPTGGTAGGNADAMKTCVDSCVQGGKTFQACIPQCEAQ